MIPKRPLLVDESHFSSAKQIKLEHPEEFSNTVKKRLATSTRTGQACDRCKVRKIRCDRLPEGCSPCLQNGTECFTTDRITGRATSRGYTEDLEQQIRDLQAHNRELEQRLRDLDAPKNQNESPEASNPIQPVRLDFRDSYIIPCRPQPQETKKEIRSTPEQVSGINMVDKKDRHIGIPESNNSLSSLKGTALSILGMEIDVADFTSEDFDEQTNKNSSNCSHNKSRQSFLKSFFKSDSSPQKIEMPPKLEALAILDWYFKAIHPYLPLLHRPSLSRLLHKMYDNPSFVPTLAQSVIVHMIFSIILFRYAVQNSNDAQNAAQLNYRSNMYYHHCLSLVGQLFASQTFEDCQALMLVCYHMRNFPKPGASWIMINATFTLALELGLHRSPKKVLTNSLLSILDIEMRKRAFWVLLGFHVDLSGKLGKPIRLRSEDLDCEIPEYVDDEALENGIYTPSIDYNNSIGIEAMKLVPLYIELYSVIYAVRRKKESYVMTINNLEAQLRSWKESLPAKQPETQEDLGFRLFTQMFQLEFRLLLRHPSAWIPDNDPAFNAESLRICVESSRQMQVVVRQIQEIRLLDTTWCNAVIYVLAITTTLFAQWEMRDESTSASLAALEDEMDIWLDVMGDVGKLLGSGDRLREAIRRVSDFTLGLLARSLSEKKRSSKKAKECFKSPSPSSLHTNPTSIVSGHQESNRCHPLEKNSAPPENLTKNGLSSENMIFQNVEPFPASSQYSSCPENSSLATVAYAQQENPQNYSSDAVMTEPIQYPSLFVHSGSCQKQPHCDAADGHCFTPQTFTSMAWSYWASTATENYQSSLCHCAYDLMQIGDWELSSRESILAGDGNRQINSPCRQGIDLSISNLGVGNIDLNRPGRINNNEWL